MANKLLATGVPMQSYKPSGTTDKYSLHLLSTNNANDNAAARKLEIRKGHSRSASHGGIGSAISPSFTGRPSALKKGHQRAFSQGQIIDSNEFTPTSTHTRTLSKTDFILPAGHRDTEFSDYNFFEKRKGHSRQASRSESVYTLRHNTPPSFWKRYLSFFTRKKNPLEESRTRTIIPNHIILQKANKNHKNGTSENNKICTTKYTLLSFLPKNLLEQFHRVANLYFIFIVLLNWFPSINAFGKEIAMIPVLFVLGVTALKDLFEDRRRHASDNRINNSTCNVYVSQEDCYKKVLWKDIRPGDLIRLTNNEVIPADVLVLRCSDSHGLCYIDTCNLDGESNLKQRYVASSFINKQLTFQPSLFQSVVEVESPTTKIYRFHGAIVHPNGEKIAVGTENLLLRECVLKNTDFIEGLVIYAGHETKAMLNNNGPRYKRSSLEKQMNTDIMWCVVILIVLCLIGAIFSSLWLSSFEVPVSQVPFLSYTDTLQFEVLLTFCTFIIILQVMIPLSLYVTIEMTKMLQVYHIHNNISLYDSEKKKRIECRALNITEELGQVQYIFSDKTGTLTENKMLFKRCTIAGVDYNHPGTSSLQTQSNESGEPTSLNQKLIDDLNDASGTNTLLSDYDDLLMSHSRLPSNQCKRVQEFMLLLALCNTVVISTHSHQPERDTSKDKDTPEDEATSVIMDTCSNRIDAFGNPLYEESQLADATDNVVPTYIESKSYKSRSFLQNLAFNSARNKRDSSKSDMEFSSNFKQKLNDDNYGQDFLSTIESSSSESSPSSSSLRQRMRSFEHFAKASRFKQKFLNAPSSFLSSANRRFLGGNKNGLQNSTVVLPNMQTKPFFEAESPDELALVETAYAYNCRLMKRSPVSATVVMPNDDACEYDILKVLPFDSSRKCMSIVLRNVLTREIAVFCKGADSTIFMLLSPPDYEMQQIIYRTQQHLNTYARQGLRVLVMAKRNLTEREYNEWAKRNREAELSIDDREKKLSKSYAELERNFILLGATGIEDRLQDGVPETISSLRAAGIVVWVLTGDKPETAINVAYSTRLFTPQMEILKLTARCKDAAENMIAFYLKEIENSSNSSSQLQDTSGATTSSDKSEGFLSFISLLSHKQKCKSLSHDMSLNKLHQRERSLVIDGKTLTYILDRRCNLQVPFLRLTTYCTSVLCCRSTPLQKAYIVRVVKDKLKMRTLAIGDGANDVSMIQAADVGIGISGQEGMQAVMASDFSISRFKFLEKFLLVHGHWCYDRLAHMVLYFFYKNAIFVFLIFWYQLFCGFSGAVMIDQMYLMLYNLFFTSLPPLVIGVYDQDAPEELLLAQPNLYSKGRLGLEYQRHSFWITMIDSVYQSLVIFFFAVWVYTDTDIGFWELGMVVVTSCMLTMLLQGCLETRSWTIIHWVSLGISLGSFFLFTFLYNLVCFQCIGLPTNTWVFQNTLATSTYWLTVIISTVTALLPRYTFYCIRMTFWPDDVNKALIQARRVNQKKENFLATWSRSTSASSVYRSTNVINKEATTSITPIG